MLFTKESAYSSTLKLQKMIGELPKFPIPDVLGCDGVALLY